MVSRSSSKKRKPLVSVRFYLIGGLIFIALIIAGPFAWRYGVILYKSGFSFSQAVQYHNLKNFGVPVPRGYSLHGIDISHHQGRINWNEVACMDANGLKVSFVFLKATEGITRQDREFERNWRNVKKAGLLRGAYHFFHPSRDARLQADNFIAQVELTSGDLAPVLDIERSNGKSKKVITEGVRKWCEQIENHYGVKPIIYTSPGFYNKYLAGSFDDYPLWIAHYYEDLPDIHHRPWHFWQHTDKARINGIAGMVDMNVFNGDPDDLQKLIIP